MAMPQGMMNGAARAFAPQFRSLYSVNSPTNASTYNTPDTAVVLNNEYIFVMATAYDNNDPIAFSFLAIRDASDNSTLVADSTVLNEGSSPGASGVLSNLLVSDSPVTFTGDFDLVLGYTNTSNSVAIDVYAVEANNLYDTTLVTSVSDDDSTTYSATLTTNFRSSLMFFMGSGDSALALTSPSGFATVQQLGDISRYYFHGVGVVSGNVALAGTSGDTTSTFCAAIYR